MLIKLSVDLLLDYEILPLTELSPVLFPLRNGDTFGCCELSFTIAGLVDESISRRLYLLVSGDDRFRRFWFCGLCTHDLETCLELCSTLRYGLSVATWLVLMKEGPIVAQDSYGKIYELQRVI
jgi:hypothetical protein